MKSILITNALIWAAVIVIASLLYNGTENYTWLLGTLTVGFTLQNGSTYRTLKRMEQREAQR